MVSFIDNLMGHGKKVDSEGNNKLLRSRLHVNEIYLKKIILLVKNNQEQK